VRDVEIQSGRPYASRAAGLSAAAHGAAERAGARFLGGEFVLVEQRPRAQSKAEVVPLAQGEAVIFAVHHRPVRGTRGWYRRCCATA
jgi:hypothetical protein